MGTSHHLSALFEIAKERPIEFDDSSRFILLSDCHRGDNSAADDFAHNQGHFFFALNHYFNEGFTYFELGDGDELWENHRFADIRQAHSHVYWLMSQFHESGRLHLIWGNHNRDWRSPGKVRQHLYSYYRESTDENVPLLPGIEVHEGIVLSYKGTERSVFLAHGHQSQPLNHSLWWLGRFIVRVAWRPLQIFGAKDPTSPAKNFRVRKHMEKRLRAWARDNKTVLIAGHTHRSRFPDVGKDEPPYFNVGSCVHPRCITGIKIDGGFISLIKWWCVPDDSGCLRLKEEVVGDTQPVKLGKLFDQLNEPPK